MVTLKRADVPPEPPNQITLKCPQCPHQFHLNYSDDEWNRVSTLIAIAERAVREDHKKQHKQCTIELNWNPIRGTR
jgi:hypothetical protein